MSMESQIAALLACPACGFDPESETTMAASLAILFMIGILACVLGGFLRFMWKLAKSERRMVAGEMKAGPEGIPGRD